MLGKGGLWLLLLLAPLHAGARAVITGIVLTNQEGGPPVPRANISADKANPTVSDPQTGHFTLTFADKGPGEEVRLVVSKPGYVVVNWIQLKATLPSDKNPTELLVIMCKQSEQEEWARRFYRLKSLDAIEESFRERIRELEADSKRSADEIAQLLQERNQAETAAAHTSDIVAQLKPGDVNDVYAQGMELFLKGDVTGARKLLKWWTDVSSELQVLLNTKPEPSNAALEQLLKLLKQAHDPSSAADRLFSTLDTNTVDSDHMYYVEYAFYKATGDPRWKEHLFARMFAEVHRSIGSNDLTEEVIASNLSVASNLNNYLRTKWNLDDRLEFYVRCLDAIEQAGPDVNKRQMGVAILNALVSGDMGFAIQKNSALQSRTVRLCDHRPADVLVDVAPEAYLVFQTTALIGSARPQDDIPVDDVDMRRAVDWPLPYEKSAFSKMMGNISNANMLVSGEGLKTDHADWDDVIGRDDVQEDIEVIHMSDVKKWWDAHQKEVRYWNNF